ncbi:uncharacterized protein JCM6883_006436 [Sporobolomyces salmoneus]|uniref:uncharacterized protein n=1 Tax=Sporobolomyces salmoneus TaxID=183962 RepID=UPI003177418A
MSSTTFLEALLRLPDAQLSHSLVLPSVYPVFLSLLSSSSNSPDRTLLHLLVSRLALLKPGLDLNLLILYIKHFYVDNKGVVEKTIDDAFTNSLSLSQSFTRLVPQALLQELESAKEGDCETVETLLLCQLIGHRYFTSSSLSLETIQSILTSLDRLYTNLDDGQEEETEPKHDQLRLLILSVSQSLLTLPSLSLDQLDSLLPFALSISFNGPLINHTERYLGISGTLGERVQGQVGRIARSVKDSIGKLKKLDNSSSEDASSEVEWVERVRRKARLGGNAEKRVDETSLRTGEKENENGDHYEEAQLVSTISSIQELFPHLSTSFLRLALDHPTIKQQPLSQASEKLIGSLLENNLPKGLEMALSKEANGSSEPQAQSQAQEVPRVEKVQEKETKKVERSNIFDEDKNFSQGKLLIPGRQSRSTPREISLDQRLKESIIALAEAPSSDEDGEGGEDGDAFLEDEENGAACGGVKVGIRDNGDEDDEDSPGSVPASGTQTPAQNLFTPSTLLLLSRLYLSSPQSFSSTSLVRRTDKVRIKLRAETGLDDSQIEGWRSQLERGGEREIERMRERIMDIDVRGNRPSASSDGDGSGSAGRGGASRGRGGSGPPRGRGTGRGRGGAGKGDGGRAQHDRRKRGNDRKMAKMGAAL